MAHFWGNRISRDEPGKGNRVCCDIPDCREIIVFNVGMASAHIFLLSLAQIMLEKSSKRKEKKLAHDRKRSNFVPVMLAEADRFYRCE